MDNLRTRYLEVVEEPLVDQANILAAIVGHEMQNLPEKRVRATMMLPKL